MLLDNFPQSLVYFLRFNVIFCLDLTHPCILKFVSESLHSQVVIIIALLTTRLRSPLQFDIGRMRDHVLRLDKHVTSLRQHVVNHQNFSFEKLQPCIPYPTTVVYQFSIHRGVIPAAQPPATILVCMFSELDVLRAENERLLFCD